MRPKQPEDQWYGKIVGPHPQAVIIAGTIQMYRDILTVDIGCTTLYRDIDLVSHMIEEPDGDGKTEKCHKEVGEKQQ